jgi:hypothetical protein
MTYIVHMKPRGIVARCGSIKGAVRVVEKWQSWGQSFDYIFDSGSGDRLSLKQARSLVSKFSRSSGRGREIQGGSPGLGRRNVSRNI